MFNLISMRRHNKIVKEIMEADKQDRQGLINDRDALYDQIQKADGRINNLAEQLTKNANEKSASEHKVDCAFWQLAQYGAIIKLSYREDFGRHDYQYVVYFKPVLKDRAGHTWAHHYRGISSQQLEREENIQQKIIQLVGVPDWEYIEADKMLKRTYFDFRSLLQAPGDISGAVDHLEWHLANFLMKETYQKVMEESIPAKDEAKQD